MKNFVLRRIMIYGFDYLRKMKLRLSFLKISLCKHVSIQFKIRENSVKLSKWKYLIYGG